MFLSAKFFGVVSRAQVEALYREARVPFFPALFDDFGHTQLERMARRRPFIASRQRGDVVRLGVSGLRLSEISATSISEAITFC
jgi:hypothetical protein